MNKVILLGRVGKDIELKHAGITEIATFSIAVNDGYGDNKKTLWINCKAFGKTAESLSIYVRKGQQIAIDGRINTGSYEKDGKTVYTTDIIVNTFYFADGKKEQSNTNVKFDIDDLPF